MIKIICWLLATIWWVSHVHAETGCMDNSKHLKNTKNGFDYKKFHYVECACPCSRWDQSYKRGRCSKCLHFKAPEDPSKKKALKEQGWYYR